MARAGPAIAMIGHVKHRARWIGGTALLLLTGLALTGQFANGQPDPDEVFLVNISNDLGGPVLTADCTDNGPGCDHHDALSTVAPGGLARYARTSVESPDEWIIAAPSGRTLGCLMLTFAQYPTGNGTPTVPMSRLQPC